MLKYKATNRYKHTYDLAHLNSAGLSAATSSYWGGWGYTEPAHTKALQHDGEGEEKASDVDGRRTLLK